MGKAKSKGGDAPALDPHPILVEHGSFEHLALGRVEARHDPRTLRLASYLDDAVLLPEIPETFDLVPQVASWPMYGNDLLGDCTIATVGHMIQAWYAANGVTVTPDEAEIVAAYWATGSSDTGRFEVDVLNFWRNQGIAGDKIVAYAYVDPQNLDHVRAALYLFGGLYTGIALPKSAQSQAVWDVVGDGKTGDSQPDSWGGHAVPYLPRWDGSRIPLVTWAHVLEATVAFHLAYCDELYAPLSADFLTAGRTPAGFDADALLADLAEIGQAAPEITGTAGVTTTASSNSATSDVQITELTGIPSANAAPTAEQEAPEPLPPHFDENYYWRG